MYFLYIIECKDKSLYTGITNDLDRRFNEHKNGMGGHYTSSKEVVRILYTEKWEGEPTETEEMIPAWYSIEKLPYENMWVDDIHWLPLVLNGKKINAAFNFNKTGDKIISMKVEEICQP